MSQFVDRRAGASAVEVAIIVCAMIPMALFVGAQSLFSRSGGPHKAA